MATIKALSLVSCVSMLCLCVSVSAEVPVIGWSNLDGVFDTSSLRVGASRSVSRVLQDNLRDVSDNTVIVVFQQDALHLEDFSHYGGVYGGDSAFPFVKAALKESTSSMVVPEVVSEYGVAEELSFLLHSQVASGSEFVSFEAGAQDIASLVSQVKEQQTVASSTAVVASVTLPSLSENKKESFITNDALMASIVQEISAQVDSNLIVLYSGNDDSKAYRTRREEPQEQIISTAQYLNRTNLTASCTRWPESPAFPNGRGTKACRPARAKALMRSPYSGNSKRQDYVPVPQPILFFSTPILMGIVVAALIIPCFLGGTFGLMVMQTNSKYPNVEDTALIISTQNE